MKIDSVNMRPTTTEDMHLPTFDNTKLVAVNTCPKFGIIRYGLHKTMGNATRPMALEAGSAAHEVFAAHRLYSFLESGAAFYRRSQDDIEECVRVNGCRIFGHERFDEMVDAVDKREDWSTRCTQFALTALYNCGFYDDPFDKRRTITNIEELCIIYMDEYDWRKKLPVLRDNGLIGIELPVDTVVTIKYRDTEGYSTLTFRFIGKTDGIHWVDQSMQKMRIHENKTASRLGNAWELSWEVNHQPCGYMLAISCLWDVNISESEMLGTCLPMPKSYAVDGVSRIIARRTLEQKQAWFRWVLHTIIQEYFPFLANPTLAPEYTHSCNRYFYPCTFIPLCSDTLENQQIMLDDMEIDEWSPLKLQDETT